MINGSIFVVKHLSKEWKSREKLKVRQVSVEKIINYLDEVVSLEKTQRSFKHKNNSQVPVIFKSTDLPDPHIKTLVYLPRRTYMQGAGTLWKMYLIFLQLQKITESTIRF